MLAHGRLIALGVEGIEGLFESFLRGFAGIDGTPNYLLTFRHDFPRLPSFFFRPKNRGPDQRVPVIVRAM